MPHTGVTPGGARRTYLVSALLGATRLGHAEWFCGNLYEAIVKVPDLQAHRTSDQAMSPLGPGSPVRYYAAAAPAVFPGLAAAIALGWRHNQSRPWLLTAAACSSLNAVLTAYLVRSVNLKVLFAADYRSGDERERMLRTWYRINAIRLALTGAAWLAAGKANRNLTQ